VPRRGDPGFDADVVRFVVGDLRSVWALEALLRLHGGSAEVWTAERLTHDLRANLAMVADILSRLEQLGLIAAEGDGFAFRPASAEIADLVDRTEAAYRQKPFAMISLIGRGAGALQDLADAFRLKGDKT
jgi:hypothetical protein